MKESSNAPRLTTVGEMSVHYPTGSSGGDAQKSFPKRNNVNLSEFFTWDAERYVKSREIIKRSLSEIPSWSNDEFHFL